jgi:Histidine phosphatase superfamily (branch 2)
MTTPRTKRSRRFLSTPVCPSAVVVTVGVLYNVLWLFPPPLGLLSIGAVVAASSRRQDWYTRYPSYPPYCSTPSEMETRRVPPLIPADGGGSGGSTASKYGETRLLHVTAVLRHGARTPWGPSLNCWEGYHDDPATAIWDCNLSTFLSPPPPHRVWEEEEGDDAENNSGDYAMFLFEKVYDALGYDASGPARNALNGTCQLGQLLLQGYGQELVNGKHLRDAYVYDESEYNHDPRLRLLNVADSGGSGKGPHPVWKDIYYRVDDEARTILSGQVVLRGLMGQELDQYVQASTSAVNQYRYPVIPLHTADYFKDIVDPNEATCPVLVEIRERNQLSAAYQAFNQSNEAVALRHFQHNVLRVPFPNHDMDAIDCLMTTMCTDRPLPSAIDDYSNNASSPSTLPPEKMASSNTSAQDWKNTTADNNSWSYSTSSEYGTNLFQRLYEFDVQQYVLNIKLNDAEYAKVGMRPLWYEILKNIKPWITENDSNGGASKTTTNEENKKVKLALFSGHDTTLMPLLASLSPDLWGDMDWPPYASMVLLEIHAVHIEGTTDATIFKSDYAFRLLYNGQVLTDRMPGCELDLCDISVLLQRLEQFVGPDQECERKHGPPIVYYTGTVNRVVEILSTTEGIVYFVVLVGGSAFMGGAVVFLYLNGSLLHTISRGRTRRRRDHHALDIDEDADGLALTRNGTVQRYHDHDSSFSAEEHARIAATLS